MEISIEKAEMLPRVILSDWGGVLSPGGTPDELPAKLEEVLLLDRAHITFLTSPLLGELKRGQISVEEFWHKLEVITGKTISDHDRNVWAPLETLRPDDELNGFYQDLIKQGYEVGILSNVFPNTEAMIRQAGWYKPYHPLFLSCDLGMAKPDNEIYEYVCRIIGVEPMKILFIDDQQRCLDPAAAIGMKTILARSPSQTIREIRNVLNLT
jgi:putative hydrolase of the HAD superfamily